MSSLARPLAVLALAIGLLAAGCGSDDDNDKSSTDSSNAATAQLAKRAADGCNELDAEAANLAKDPSENERSAIEESIRQIESDAAVTRDDAKQASAGAGASIGDAAKATDASARKLEDVASDDDALKNARAAKTDFEECRGLVEKADSKLADGVSDGEGFDALINSLKGGEQTSTTDEPTTTTGPGPGGGETSDLPLCSEDVTPCRNPDGSVDEGAPSGAGPGPGGGESSDLPPCTEGPPPCRSSDGSVQP